MILAIDPGKDKCGLAILDESGNTLERKVLERHELPRQVLLYLSKYGIPVIVVGKSAFGKAVERELLKLEVKANLIFVSEKDSTWEARRRYWKENPPSGWLKLFPTSLRTPPAPIDDYAAVILGERYLKS